MGEILRDTWRNNVWLKFLTITGVLLIIASFIVPPTGLIDNSVILAVGELEIFGVLWIINKAIEKGTGTHFKKGDIEVEIHQKDEEEGDE